MSNKYLPAQMSGPIATGVEVSGIAEFATSDGVLTYLQTLSIDNANDDVLTIIGELIGLPWPTAPIGTYDNNYLTLSLAASAPQYDSLTGLGTLANPTIGGLLTSVDTLIGLQIPIAVYRQVLKSVAQIKQQGFTLATVDALVSIFTLNYTMAWNAFHDLVVTFNPDIDAGALFTLNLVMDLFYIDPIIVLVQI